MLATVVDVFEALHEVAGLLYPNYSDSTIPQVIKYEKYIVLLRKAIQAKQKAGDLARAEARHHPEWKRRVLRQEPWDEIEDPLPLTGAAALPMPVTIRYVSWDGVEDILPRLCTM